MNWASTAADGPASVTVTMKLTARPGGTPNGSSASGWSVGGLVTKSPPASISMTCFSTRRLTTACTGTRAVDVLFPVLPSGTVVVSSMSFCSTVPSGTVGSTSNSMPKKTPTKAGSSNGGVHVTVWPSVGAPVTVQPSNGVRSRPGSSKS